MIRIIIILLFVLVSAVHANSDHAAPKRVAVLELRHPKALAAEAVSYLADRVRQIAQARAGETLLLLTRQNLSAMLPPGTRLEDCEGECEVEAGRNIGVDYVIAGRVLPFESGLRAILTLHDTASGRQVASGHARGNDLRAIEAGLVAATQRLVDAVPEVRALQGPLEAQAAVGGAARLQVKAPRGTRIQIDGVQSGMAPTTLSVRPGGRRIELTHACGGRWQGTLALIAGQAIPLDVDFEGQCVGVDMQTVPSGARLTIDGADMGETPTRVYLKSRHTHRIGLRKAGLLPTDTTLYLVKARSSPWVWHLLPPKKTARIIASRPDGSECQGALSIDGRKMGQTPWSGVLAQGRYTVKTVCGPRTGERIVNWPQVQDQVDVRTEDNNGELRFDIFGPSHWQVGIGGWFMARKQGSLRVGLEGHTGRYRLNHADPGYDKAVNHVGGALRFAVPMSDWLDWTLAGAVDIGWTGCADDAPESSDCKGKERQNTFDIFPMLSGRTGLRYDIGMASFTGGVGVHRPFMFRIPEFSVVPYLGTSLTF